MSNAPRPNHSPALASLARTLPFASAEEAWFWTMAALTARRDGARITAGKGIALRPCEPDDVIKCLDRLYRQRRIEIAHARIMRIWGERGTAPNPRHTSERGDHRLWAEAVSRLEWPLRVKGIVVLAAAVPEAPESGPSAAILPFAR
jgi:hypothetical protein